MSKIIVLLVLLFEFCLINNGRSLHLKNTKQKQLRKMLESKDDGCDSNIFLIISRKTGYNLTLAYQVYNENGISYYWVKLTIFIISL